VSLKTPEEIRNLQRGLYAKAKAEPAFRFYLLYDKVYREDILEHAYRLARSKGGAPGVDGVRFEDIESAGLEKWLASLRKELCEETYRPSPVRRVKIPKPGGGERPLGIPTLRDRVAQTAAKLVLEPIFGAARNGVDHAGESPAAAIARFGCVAIPDGPSRRLLRSKAQANVLEAARSDPTGGLANSGAVAVANTTASSGSPRGNWVAWFLSGPSLSKMGAGQRCH